MNDKDRANKQNGSKWIAMHATVESSFQTAKPKATEH